MLEDFYDTVSFMPGDLFLLLYVLSIIIYIPLYYTFNNRHKRSLKRFFTALNWLMVVVLLVYITFILYTTFNGKYGLWHFYEIFQLKMYWKQIVGPLIIALMFTLAVIFVKQKKYKVWLVAGTVLTILYFQWFLLKLDSRLEFLPSTHFGLWHWQGVFRHLRPQAKLEYMLRHYYWLLFLYLFIIIAVWRLMAALNGPKDIAEEDGKKDPEVFLQGSKE